MLFRRTFWKEGADVFVIIIIIVIAIISINSSTCQEPVHNDNNNSTILIITIMLTCSLVWLADWRLTSGSKLLYAPVSVSGPRPAGAKVRAE